jgi:hypothetical protein
MDDEAKHHCERVRNLLAAARDAMRDAIDAAPEDEKPILRNFVQIVCDVRAGITAHVDSKSEVKRA